MSSKAIYHGEINVTGTAQIMPSVPAGLVWFKTPATNTGKIYIGNNAVAVTANQGTTNTTAGYEMSESESWGPLAVENLSRLSVIGTDDEDSLLYFVMA